ncbi:hypothetical protein [Arthrobacter sp. B2a2-09]|uniref:hypothetical protein n=1 Tax=Arthrobacter sp. B2a2-09 TaxID=2952822 RepID=UPI0022CD344E|nr:hypothetical protein [Arthrobacter sp. B2a2-09]MCZ9880634.1 hypothetical protein [Arthrobacter sp. B2a2-09]
MEEAKSERAGCRAVYPLNALVRAAAGASHTTVPAIGQALAVGEQDVYLPALMAGATILAQAEFRDRPEGLSLAILDRAEQILHDTVHLRPGPAEPVGPRFHVSCCIDEEPSIETDPAPGPVTRPGPG